MLRILRWLLYALYLIAVVFAGAEASLRLGIIDSEALRIDRRVKQAARGPRFLILGDSFSVEAPGLFASHLQAHLASRGIVSLNLSRAGYGPLRYAEVMKVHGVKFRPDVVLLTYFVGNDLSDTLYSAKGFTPAARLWLCRSYLAAAMLELRANMIVKQRLDAILRDPPTGQSMASVTESAFLIELGRKHPGFFLTNLLIKDPRAQEAWETNKSTLLEIKHLAETWGGRLLISVFPSDIQIHKSRHDFYKNLGFVLDEGILTSSVPQDLMSGFCRDRGIACRDLLPGFREQADRPFYRERDFHWNDRGNLLAFELVKEFVDDQSPDIARR